MQTVKTTLIILICIVLLGACGNKGPLYLPEEEATTEQGLTTDADKKEENEDKKKSSLH
ncbi:MAG: lipoprotein [Xanthomonadales bacterium]|nr:lipoprotein [Xanthomonadales bacterium]